ncbi:MAG: RidA family protein [Peptostreptococcaceae bacterium]|nr:RidA family protein [Peptostreptococcaceae bacterium]
MKAVVTEKAPQAIGAYSQGLDLGNMIFTSGQLPIDPATGEMPESAAEQAEQSLKNVKAIVEAAGSDMSKVVKTVIFLQDINDFGAVNEVYASFFEEPYPARSCVEVGNVPKGALCEIEAIAVK